MRKLYFLFSLIAFSLSSNLSAQMTVGNDLLYGNEWIDYSKEYYKILIQPEDGIYRVTSNDLQAAGFPVSSVRGTHLRLMYMGQEIPIYVTTTGALGASDYIEFFGKKI